MESASPTQGKVSRLFVSKIWDVMPWLCSNTYETRLNWDCFCFCFFSLFVLTTVLFVLCALMCTTYNKKKKKNLVVMFPLTHARVFFCFSFACVCLFVLVIAQHAVVDVALCACINCIVFVHFVCVLCILFLLCFVVNQLCLLQGKLIYTWREIYPFHFRKEIHNIY